MAQYIIRRAKQLIEQNNAEEAARLLSTWLRDHPGDTRARDYLASAYFSMGAYQEALAALESVLKQWPHKARCWRNYAMVLRKLGRLDEAYDAANQAIEIDPNYAAARVELRKIRRLMRLPRCGACGLPVETADETPCRKCGWVYHEWCWSEAQGCINPACGAQREVAPRTSKAFAGEKKAKGCLPVLLGMSLPALAICAGVWQLWQWAR